MLRGQLDGAPRRRLVENVFALSSALIPFALGTVVGAVASGRVPVGNAPGDLVASWLNPTSVLIGVSPVRQGLTADRDLVNARFAMIQSTADLLTAAAVAYAIGHVATPKGP